MRNTHMTQKIWLNEYDQIFVNMTDFMTNVILVLSYIEMLFFVYSFPTSLSTAFAGYYIDPQTNSN